MLESWRCANQPLKPSVTRKLLMHNEHHALASTLALERTRMRICTESSPSYDASMLEKVCPCTARRLTLLEEKHV